MFARIVKEYELLVSLKEINAHRDTMPFTEFIRHNIVDLGVILAPKYYDTLLGRTVCRGVMMVRC